MNNAIYEGDNSAFDKIEQNAEQGRRTLLLCFYAGHGASENNRTKALFNSNDRDINRYDLEDALGCCAM